VVVLLGSLWSLLWKWSLLRMDARGSWGLIMEYDNERRALGEMGIQSTVVYLDGIAHAGLNATDPYLTKIMQRERARAVQDVIQELRKKTGEDLGDDPEAWIKKYYRSAEATPPPKSQSTTRPL
jgi:hypothetical protein